jgi:energy-coupling factor transport system ATP-binding protein
VVLLDEPTRGMEPVAKKELSALLTQWRVEGKATLLVTHDVELVASLADRVALMEEGRIIQVGRSGEVLAASEKFAPQIGQLFPGRGWLTVDDVLEYCSSNLTRSV